VNSSVRRLIKNNMLYKENSKGGRGYGTIYKIPPYTCEKLNDIFKEEIK
jgi:predicted transcriptional regulator